MSNKRSSNDRGRRGAGRRTWPQDGGPRVGRVATNVPRAEKVDGEGREDGSRERYVPRAGRSDDRRRGGFDRTGERFEKLNRGNNRRDGGFGRTGERFEKPNRGNNRYARRDGDFNPGFDRNDPDRFVPAGKPAHSGEGAPGRAGFVTNPHRRDEDPARRISGEARAEREDFDRPAWRERPHHGAAWRSESGPGRRGDASPEEVPDDAHILAGRNPIREALRAGRPVEKLLVARGDLSGSAREIIKLAKAAGAVVQEVDRSRLDSIAPNHQGMVAYAAAVPYASIADILSKARDQGVDPFVVLLDGVTDPHNLGAIIRTAECAGAHGVVIPERRAAGLTPVVAKAAAGALNHMPIARVPNLNRAIDELKQEGLWVIGTAMDGEDALTADFTGPVALVIGSEGEGISRLTLEKCDSTVTLPMRGHIESLNASVAAGILMYAILRARAK